MEQDTFSDIKVSRMMMTMMADDIGRTWVQKIGKFPDPASIQDKFRPMTFTETKRGNFEIASRKIKEADVVTFRNAYLLGINPCKIKFDKKLEFHRLLCYAKKGHRTSLSKLANPAIPIRHGILTTDSPNEVYMQYISFRHMKGDVLVGGLGLGLAAELIRQLPDVTSVTVVDREKDLIELIQPQMHKDIKVVKADLFAFLVEKENHRKYDSAYFDIWYDMGERTWNEFVAPLYRLARKAGINTLGSWCEFDMISQLFSPLYILGLAPELVYSEWRPYDAFLSVARGKDEKTVVELLKLYLSRVGTPKWEKTFGKYWDAKRRQK